MTKEKAKELFEQAELEMKIPGSRFSNDYKFIKTQCVYSTTTSTFSSQKEPTILYNALDEQYKMLMPYPEDITIEAACKIILSTYMVAFALDGIATNGIIFIGKTSQKKFKINRVVFNDQHFDTHNENILLHVMVIYEVKNQGWLSIGVNEITDLSIDKRINFLDTELYVTCWGDDAVTYNSGETKKYCKLRDIVSVIKELIV